MSSIGFIYASLGMLISAAPVKLGAVLLNTRRSGYVICFVATLVGILVWAEVAKLIHYGVIFGVFASAVVYMLALGTTYWKAWIVAFIQMLALTTYVYAVFSVLVSAIFESIGLH